MDIYLLENNLEKPVYLLNNPDHIETLCNDIVMYFSE